MNTRIALSLVLAASLAGCVTPTPEACDLLDSVEADLATAEITVTPRAQTGNRVGPHRFNGMRLNALGMNALGLNAMGFNAMSQNAWNNGLSSNALANGLSKNAMANGLRMNGRMFNGRNLNGHRYNGKSLNALTYNAFSRNALSRNGLEGTPDVATVAADELGREFLEYGMGCALPAGSELRVEVDGETIVFPGALGLAPGWMERGMTDAEERRFTGCMMAHVNAFGITVPISVRTPDDRIEVTDAEAEAFAVHEATFFGSLRDGELKACFGETPEDARLLSSDREDRICADADEPCGFDVVGACADVAVPVEAVSVHLRDDAVEAACAAL